MIESNLRSLIKSLSWRLIAIADTILVVLLVTCIAGQCNIEHAITIGGIEFVFKFIVYYAHERVWQRVDMVHRTDRTRTIVKTFSWRFVATIMTIIIAETILERSNSIVLTIAVIEIFSKTIFYYLHERLWLVLPLGKIRNLLYEKKYTR